MHECNDAESHREALDRLVLGHTSCAVCAANCGCVAAAVLVAATIPPLLGHGLKRGVLRQYMYSPAQGTTNLVLLIRNTPSRM